jgi:hypothetical protein
MERKTYREEPRSDNRRPPLALRRYHNSAGELPGNGEEQECDARDHQDSRDWSTLQRLDHTLHRAPSTARLFLSISVLGYWLPAPFKIYGECKKKFDMAYYRHA